MRSLLKRFTVLVGVTSILTGQASAGCPLAAPAAPSMFGSLSAKYPDQAKPDSIHYQNVAGDAVFQGDIILGKTNDLRRLSQAKALGVSRGFATTDMRLQPFGETERGIRLWPGATVPYQIDPALGTVAALVRQAMQAWSDRTGKIKFAEVTPANAGSHGSNLVYFTVGQDPRACLSQGLGMIGGRQFVKLVSGCEYGQILHEIGHVLGLQHEQNRTDRNRFVDIFRANIDPDYLYAFDISRGAVDVGNYDLDSTMHYEATAFACDRSKPTIQVKPVLPPGTVPLPPGGVVGQRTHISDGDVRTILRLYQNA